MLGSTLPAEIIYLGNSHLAVNDRKKLEELDGVVARDMSQMFNHHEWKLADLSSKTYAILYSSFRGAILIHAGTLFQHNPGVLFDDLRYR